MIAHAKVDALYGALTPPERARLMARCFRTGDTETIRRIRESLPDGQAQHYNRLLRIARRLHSPLVDSLAAILHGAQRDAEALLHMLAQHAHEKLAWIGLWDVWELVPYPVTRAEHDRVIALERERPEPLDAFATHLSGTWTAEEAAQKGWRTEVVAFLAQETDWDEAGWEAQALALLHAAIRRGELPQPSQTEEGPALPWGVLVDWLEPSREGYTPYGPDYHVPCVELLGGNSRARWEIRPDEQALAVRARQEQIARTLAGMALLPIDQLPSIHPPATLAEQEEQRAQVQAVWPWRGLDWREAIGRIGARHAEIRTEWRIMHGILGEIRDEDFGGEDPTPESIRPLLARVAAAVDEMATRWAEAGEVLAKEAWPAVPELDEATRDRLQGLVRANYRDADD